MSDNEQGTPRDDLGALVDEVAALELHAFTNGYYGATNEMRGLAHDLAAGIRALGERYADSDYRNTHLEGELVVQQQRITQLEEAARFYADPALYYASVDDRTDGLIWAPILDDEGARARAVLPEYRQKGTGAIEKP
jgi:hypothetical protein